ncbi:MAG: SDR family NAD(P)-dependent oxidoreductase, partial [Verrucomicrobiales bacterium]|nr:SDR family NAD(P)-dependent oxidoreductase [Verrucomicrobiales bacterium]
MNNASHISLSGKRALVTASSQGIGEAIAVGLARAGSSVAVNYHSSEQAARETVARCEAHGPGHIAVHGDALEEANTIWTAASEEMGRPPNILVCNYGPFHFGKVSDMSANEFESIVSANLFSAHRMVARALPDLCPGGTIILIGLSCVADELQAAPNVAPYAIGKA